MVPYSLRSFRTRAARVSQTASPSGTTATFLPSVIQTWAYQPPSGEKTRSATNIGASSLVGKKELMIIVSSTQQLFYGNHKMGDKKSARSGREGDSGQLNYCFQALFRPWEQGSLRLPPVRAA